MPAISGIRALPDIPVANTSCFGRSVSGIPSRSTSTVHSPVSSDQVAEVAVVLDQYGTSITFTYDSSQSPILSFGANTGQLSGNFRYGRWSYQTGSCRQSDLYLLRHWSPGRGCLSTTRVGTPSWRSREPRAMPPWPPPMTSTYGCVVLPRLSASACRCSFHVRRSLLAPCSAPIGRCVPRGSS